MLNDEKVNKINTHVGIIVPLDTPGQWKQNNNEA